MKQIDILKAIKFGVAKKNGHPTAKVLNLCEYYLNSNGGKYHFLRWSGGARKMTLTGESKHETLRDLLTVFGFKYEIGNDAPRGGIEGTYIKCSKTAVQTIKAWAESFK